MENVTSEKLDEVFEQAFEPGYQLDKEGRYEEAGQAWQTGLSLIPEKESRARMSCYASEPAVLSLATRKTPFNICSGCTGWKGRRSFCLMKKQNLIDEEYQVDIVLETGN